MNAHLPTSAYDPNLIRARVASLLADPSHPGWHRVAEAVWETGTANPLPNPEQAEANHTINRITEEQGREFIRHIDLMIHAVIAGEWPVPSKEQAETILARCERVAPFHLDAVRFAINVSSTVARLNAGGAA